MPAVEIAGLEKRFGDTRALGGLSLSVAPAQIYGVLGPNGAGKTTMIRILATLLRPDGGSAKVLGHDVVREAEAVRSRISLTGQFAALDGALTGRENLSVLGRLEGLGRAGARRRAAALIEEFGLSGAADRPVKTYSGGMRRRLDLAAGFITRPDLLFLDEPTTGLDPHSRGEVWKVVRQAAADGSTVLLTTQYLDEADQLADRIAVIDRGKLIAEGTPGELKSSIGSGKLELRLRDPAERSAAARLLAEAAGARVNLGADPATLSVSVDRADGAAALIVELQRAGAEVTAFSLGQPSLDEVFLALTGRPPVADAQLEEAA
ncbi:MAG TPA: ATP-binding cassette domain-containing protein [Thermoleophilaceae bacterium]